MYKPPTPMNEEQRQRVLEAYHILDTAPEESFDDLVTIAAGICNTPLGAITLIDGNRQWLKAEKGLGIRETPRHEAFCAHAINKPGEVMIVEDARKDVRFEHHPYVENDPKIRFYAGAPLVTSEGLALGALCVIDYVPHELNDTQVHALEALARQVMRLLELHKQRKEQEWYEQKLRMENAQLQSLSSTDPLTGLLNRRGIWSAVLNIAPSANQYPWWVAILDIDHFKRVNDTFGHAAGDVSLKRVAEHLTNHAPTPDIVGRLGGEEFIWLLQGTQSDAAKRVESLRQEIERDNSHQTRCTVSIGMSPYDASRPLEESLSIADEELYKAKGAGRNQVCWKA